MGVRLGDLRKVKGCLLDGKLTKEEERVGNSPFPSFLSPKTFYHFLLIPLLVTI